MDIENGKDGQYKLQIGQFIFKESVRFDGNNTVRVRDPINGKEVRLSVAAFQAYKPEYLGA